MLCDFKLFYRSSSIQKMKHVLRPNLQFLKFEACNTVLNDIYNRCEPMIHSIQPPKHTKRPKAGID